MLSEGIYQYQDSLQDTWWWRGREAIISALADIKGVVLDVGCGTMPHPEAIGVDYHPIVHSITGGVRADACRLPFANETADTILALDLLEHIKDDAGAIAEFHRVLRPGGSLVAIVPAHKWLWGLHDELLGHYRRYTRKEVAKLLKRFNAVYLSHFGGLILPGQLFVRRGMQSINGTNDIPGWLDKLLYTCVRIDAAIIPRIPLPLGGSIIAVAEKLP